MTENELETKLEALVEEKINQRLKNISPVKKNLRHMFRPVNIFKYIIPVFLISSMVTLAQDLELPHFFRDGQILDADSLNINFNEIKTNINTLNKAIVPLGGVIAWHKNLITDPADRTLPEGYVECNGQILDDDQSIFDTQVIPNLNGNSGGVNSPGHSSKVAMFLRGGVTSGSGQTHAFQGHHHASNEYADSHNHGMRINTGNPPGSGGLSGFPGNGGYPMNDSVTIHVDVREPSTRSANGSVSYGDETRPANMSIVWVMRVK